MNIILLGASLIGNYPQEFVDYHVQVALERIEDETIFLLIQQNIEDLQNAGLLDYAAKELIFLIEEGHKIDSYNMSKLIETIDYANPRKKATEIIIKAIEFDSEITPTHLAALIKLLTHANPTDDATKILIYAIERGIPFGAKERLLLAEASKVANARSNVEKIRKALHERTMREQNQA